MMAILIKKQVTQQNKKEIHYFTTRDQHCTGLYLGMQKKAAYNFSISSLKNLKMI